MFLQTSSQNRRRFLLNSLRGAGGMFLLPMLLESCTDHEGPGPGPGGDHPLFAPQFDWNDDAKIAITSAVEMIPEAGDILGGLIDILWPETTEDVWGEIKEQVEALIDQAIAAEVYKDVSTDLTGLKNSLTLYHHELVNGSPASILDQWIVTRNLFAYALPHFQSSGNELPLLPLFGQFGTLYLGLLRDGALFGLNWGMSAGDFKQVQTDLDDSLGSFYEYALATFYAGANDVANKTPKDYHNCEPFRTTNKFIRQMTLTVLDFINLWGYFDISIYPNGVPGGVDIDRLIFSDPFGTCDDSGNINLTSIIPPAEMPTAVSVWAGDRINLVQVTYPAGKGPDRATQTKGGAGGGSNQPPLGGSFNITPGNPMVWGRATWGSIVNSMQLGFSDGTATQMYGGGGTGGLGGNDTGPVGYPLEAVYMIHINGESYFYGSADCVVFCFMYWESPSDKQNALRDLYVKTPKERTAAELTRKLSSGVSGGGLITEELKAARKAYLAYIDARAKEIRG